MRYLISAIDALHRQYLDIRATCWLSWRNVEVSFLRFNRLLLLDYLNTT